jgi:hypothetical protein
VIVLYFKRSVQVASVRKYFDIKRVKEVNVWDNDKLHDLYKSHNVVWMLKCSRQLWAGHGEENKFIQNVGRKIS